MSIPPSQMARTDIEKATLHQALVFYQQHLLSERHKYESQLPKNGKLAATPEDISREGARNRQLQAIAALMESQQSDANPAHEAVTISNSLLSEDPQLSQQAEPDTEPYINPVTGQWIFPETKFSPGPSNSAFVSDAWGLVDFAKSQPLIHETLPINSNEQAAPVPNLTLESMTNDADESHSRANSSQRSSVKRKPVRSTMNTGQYAVTAGPELWLPSVNKSVLADSTTYPPSITENASSIPPVHYANSNRLVGGSVVSSMGGSLDSREAVIHPIPLDPLKTMHNSSSISGSSASFSDRESPWALMSRPSEASSPHGDPPIHPITPPSRELSWQSATWAHVMSTAQKPATPGSVRSRKGEEIPWNSGAQTVSPKVIQSDGSFVTQQHHSASRSPVPTRGLERPLNAFGGQDDSQSHWSSSQPPPAVSGPRVSFREQPSFNTAGLAKFGEVVGARSISRSPQMCSPTNTASVEVPTGDRNLFSFSSQAHRQKMVNGYELGESTGAPGPGRSLPSDARPPPTFSMTELGRFPDSQSIGGGFTGGAGQQKPHPCPPAANHREVSSVSSPFQARGQPWPEQPPPTARAMSNDSMYAFSNRKQSSCTSQLPNLNGPTLQQSEKYRTTDGIEDNDPMRLAARIAQRFDNVSGALGPNEHNRPMAGSTLSGSLALALRSGNELRSKVVDFHQDSQAFDFPRSEPNRIAHHLDSSSFKLAERFDARHSQLGEILPEPLPLKLQASRDGIVPNQLAPSTFGTRSHLDPEATPSRATSRYIPPSTSHNEMVPNQLKHVDFGSEGVVAMNLQQGGLSESEWAQSGRSYGGTLSASQENSLRVAQSISDRAERDERALLQRMQDDFNREDEKRLAKQEDFARRVQDSWNASSPAHSSFERQQGFQHAHFNPQSLSFLDRFKEAAPLVSGRKSPPLRPFRRNTNVDDVQFAPALEDDDINPDFVVKVPKITAPAFKSQSKGQRAPEHKSAAQTNGSFDARNAAAAEIAKYDAAQRALEESAKQSALDNIKAAQAEAKVKRRSNQRECVGCGDKDSASDMAILLCDHPYCALCIADAFKHALAAGKVFICCDKMPAPVEVAARFLPSDFVTRYKIKMGERAAPNPMYCAKPGCAAFIPPGNLKGPMATCGECGFVSCSLCKNPEHKGVCPPDQLGLKLMDLAGNKNWTQSSSAPDSGTAGIGSLLTSRIQNVSQNLRITDTANMASRALRIGLIPGDGIGREVIPAGKRILESLPSSLGLSFSFVDLDAGYDCFKRTGTALPRKTVETLQKECDGALFGAVSSPTTKVAGYTSPIVALRKELSLYANVRPCKTTASPAFKSPTPHPIDLVIVRENTEDLYVKEEKTYPDPSGEGQIAEAIKRISSKASWRIANIAGEIAQRRQKMRQASPMNVGGSTHSKEAMVTITHKSNVLSQTDGLFRSTARACLSQPQFSSLKVEEQIVDSMVYKLFLQPQYYDVIVAPNLYGDLLSDGAAALVGSLGLVPSANVGEGIVIGEPCHGSAPDIEGKGIANPIATIRSVGVMLEFLDLPDAANFIYKAVDAGLAEGKHVSPDLGGTAKTEEVLQDVIKRM